MRRCLIIIIFVLSIILSSGIVIAWTSYTHEWICNKAGLSELDCKSADYNTIKSQHPDLRSVNHHCTNDFDNCNARVYARKYLDINTLESRGFAAHLFADSMVPVHWYSLDYDSCHKVFEDKVEEKLKNSENIKYVLLGSTFDFSSWNVTMQCDDKKNNTIQLSADNQYMNQVAKYVAEEMYSNYMEQNVEEYDFSSVVIIVSALLTSVLILFLYNGFKNRK